MAITMQGSWIIRVKSKSAAFPQRFVVSGASTGNGNYEGRTGLPEVHVSGTNWMLTIIHNPGTGYMPSAMQLKHPIASGGFYTFDIESNDSWSGDADFNDLILTCRTPVTDEDFILYGNVSYYHGRCIFNPCFLSHLVIDNWQSLMNALQIRKIREIIEQLYPEVLWRWPIPGPDPGPLFKPLVIPLDEEMLPKKTVQKLTVQSREVKLPEEKKSKKPEVLKYNSVERVEIMAMKGHGVSMRPGIDTSALREYAKRLKLRCETGPVPGAFLQFLEYDRTSAELGGGVYTGTGSREYLGRTVTDINGNFLFRFNRSVAQFLDEAFTDLAPGEDYNVQKMPDVIIQLLDSADGSTVRFETAPYWNIPLIKRINICIPNASAGIIGTPCDGQSIIQRIGNIIVGPPDPVTGRRVTVDNVLTQNGIITARHYLGPQVRCAAWTGNLALWGCLKDKAIKYYTVQYKKPSDWTWKYINDDLTLPKYAVIFGLLTVINQKVGRFFFSKGALTASVPAYLNIETDPDPDWMVTMRNLKAFINSSGLTSTPGPVQIRIDGYDTNGIKIASTEEIITLYIDNTGVDAVINPNVEMNGIAKGNCALFKLPVDAGNVPIEGAPLTVRFKAVQEAGFMNYYELYMNKGATGGFAVTPGVEAADWNPWLPAFLTNVANRGRTYHFISDTLCNTDFQGTINEQFATPDHYYEVTLRPASGRWLEPDQTFCAFSINLSGSFRHTDGSTGYPDFWGGQVLIGIQR
jgi:hypothetical protein